MGRHVTHELSAYLDGECRMAEKVEAHLRECAQCAARLDQLRRISAGMKRLECPDVSPAFVTRVLAHTTEPEPRRIRSIFKWATATACAMAAAMLVFVLATHRPDRATVNEDRVAQALAQRPDLEEVLSTFENEPRDMPEDVVSDVAESDLLAQLADEATVRDDLDEVIKSMSEDELTEFKQLLHEYREEV